MFLIYSLIGSAAIVSASFLRREQDKFNDICVALGLSVFCLVPLLPSTLLAKVESSRDFDLQLAQADRWLHLDTTMFSQWAYSTPWAREVLLTVYVSLPLALALVWLLSGRSAEMVRSVVWTGVIAFFIFALIPATGPAHAFAGYPWHPMSAATYRLDLNSPRNAIPSMHMTWALLALIYARGKWVRCGAFAFAVLTGLSAIGGGEHYMIDLLAAVPFTAIIQLVIERFTCSMKSQSELSLASE